MVLWYRGPAKVWEEALPVGNGQLGAMIFGGVASERVQINEKSLWSGGPQDADNPDALEALPRIRELLFAGDYAEAEALTRRTQVCRGPGSDEGSARRAAFGCYQTLGELDIDFTDGAQTSITDYRRELDLDEAVARVTFRSNGHRLTRETFATAPDRVLVTRLTCERSGGLSFVARLTRSERVTTRVDGDRGLVMMGQLFHGFVGGMKFAARLLVVPEGGSTDVSEGRVQVRGADAATLLVAAATDYRSAFFEHVSRERVVSAATIPYDVLRRRHLADHRRLFRRTRLDLGLDATSELATDERLGRVAAGGGEDRALVALYFHYGRYLLIASSRPGELPANLQGIWADGIQTPWNGDYHTNINVQMNYWLAETANLAECAEPLIDLIDLMREPGRITATVHYGARGWVVHTVHNVWGYTSPGEDPSWGLSPLAGAWLCQHLWEHYAFGRDVDELRRVFPIMRECAEFCLDWLVEDPKTGRLVSGPANSPENTFIAADGRRYAISMGPSMDQQILWEHFTNVLDAARALGVDDDLVRSVRAARQRLARPKIGSDGRLMEWADEFQEAEPHHRHVSHLFGLHPGREITPRATPQLAQAARKTLEVRGDEGTGWSMAWKICFWARLGDGDHAAVLLHNLVFPCALRGPKPGRSGAGVYPNLFCSHPPFQIDGNFGAVAGIAEMLVQSHENVVVLLPALPASWPTGSVRGLRARGGFEVDIAWSDGHLTCATVRCLSAGPCVIEYRGRVARKDLAYGESWQFDA